ncbi:hypothetical protein [Pseudomonas sp. MWU13-2105]|uniref:hypothetical protein n=1 Tax=Pseudomonas sp. MWU13-2105 TaxID=2935074 RepID=UPI00200ED558|nr:hypothetical protein [Pseudomonas sp. MWU13-2105]
MVRIVIYVSPLGAFGGMAFTVGKYGVGSIGAYGNLLFILLLTSKGAASVTGEAFITQVAALGSLDVIPAAGLVLVLGSTGLFPRAGR